MAIDIQHHEQGCVLRVRAQPNAKKAGIIGEYAGALKVAVTAPARDGRANEALLTELRNWLGVRRGHIELISGDTSRDKRFLIHGMTEEELTTRLAKEGMT